MRCLKNAGDGNIFEDDRKVLRPFLQRDYVDESWKWNLISAFYRRVDRHKFPSEKIDGWKLNKIASKWMCWEGSDATHLDPGQLQIWAGGSRVTESRRGAVESTQGEYIYIWFWLLFGKGRGGAALFNTRFADRTGRAKCELWIGFVFTPASRETFDCLSCRSFIRSKLRSLEPSSDPSQTVWILR